MDDGRITEDDKAERPGIQSAEVAAAILRALAEGGGAMRLSALAAATGLHRGKVHRYLVSLARTGLVVQDEKASFYAIGPLAVTVGLVGLRRLDPVRLAYDALPGLRDRVNETVVLAIWGDMGATVIALEESAQTVTLNVRVGSTLPLSISAMGRVFAAYLPAAVTAPFLAAERARAEAGHGRALPDETGYQRILEEIRRTRLSRVEGTLLPGLNAMAAPVFDYRGKLSSVIGLVGHRDSFDMQPDGPIATILTTTAAELSARLGFVEPRGSGAR
ncbi:MAG TPA: IclR family transcriptional regulator [Alphaproteobacteria bacterium]